MNDYSEVEHFLKEEKGDFVADMCEIMYETISKICVFADKYNLDRDNMFDYFVDTLALTAKMGTIKNFEVVVHD